MPKPIKVIVIIFLFSTAWHIQAAQPDAASNTSATNAALKKSLSAAQQGNAHAQFQLGLQYMKGQQLAQDMNQAFFWFGKAANQNHAEAQYYYASFLLKGIAGPASAEQAFNWYKKSAEQGYLAAQNSLGIMYMTGIGTAVNNEAAFNYLSKVAQADGADAMYNLGQLYEKGLGVQQDSKMAVQWYEKSAKHGFALAEFELGVAHANGLGGYKVDKLQAKDWYEKAAHKGIAVAQHNLANLYVSIRPELPSAAEKSQFYYKQAADQGLAASQYIMGVAELDAAESQADSGIHQLKGLEWLSKAAQQGYEAAIEQLAQFNKLREARFVELRTSASSEMAGEKYASLTQLSNDAKQGVVVAQGLLGAAYQYGLLDVKPDMKQAADWYIKAFNNNDKQAYRFLSGLSQIYTEGSYHAAQNKNDDAVKVKLKLDDMAAAGDLTSTIFLARYFGNNASKFFDKDAALKWYEKAAASGHAGAQLAAARLNANETNVAGYSAVEATKKALYWYKKVANDSMPYAQLELASLYLRFSTEKQDYEHAERLLLSASDHGVLKANLILADAYHVNKIMAHDKTNKSALLNELACSLYQKKHSYTEDFYRAVMLLGSIQSSSQVNMNYLPAHAWYALAHEAAAHPEFELRGQRLSGLNYKKLEDGTQAKDLNAILFDKNFSGGQHQDNTASTIKALEWTLSRDEIKASHEALKKWKADNLVMKKENI